MAFSVQIQCIRKKEEDRPDPHERITHIGGGNTDNSRWTLTQVEAIAGIETGNWTFYVARNGHSVGVVVAVTASGKKYLKVVGDGEEPDNLLGLPRCRGR